MSAPGGTGPLPYWLNSEVGYALWWLTHPERGVQTGPEIIDRLVARGVVESRAEARAVLRQARADVTAQRRLVNASVGQSLRSACNYECAADTPIALRVRFDVVDRQGQIVGQRSIVINAVADQNLGFVLERARQLFNSFMASSSPTAARAGIVDRALTPADVDQVLLNYTEGRGWA